MLNEAITYARCTWVNKPLTVGYMTFFTQTYFSQDIASLGFLGDGIDTVLHVYTLGAIFLTSAGFDTYASYKKMSKHLAKHGEIKPKFREKLSQLYCNQVGYQLAIDDAGLEEKL